MNDFVLCVPSLGCAIANHLYEKTGVPSVSVVDRHAPAVRGKPAFKWTVPIRTGLFGLGKHPIAFVRYPIDGEVVRIPYWETFWSNDKLVHEKGNLPFSESHIDSQREMILCIRTKQRNRVRIEQVYDEFFEEIYRVGQSLGDAELKYLCDAEREWMADGICPVVTYEDFRTR